MGKTKEAGKKKKRQRQIFTDRPARYAIRAVLRRAVTPSPLIRWPSLAAMLLSPRPLGMHGRGPRPAQGWFRSRGPPKHGACTFTAAAATAATTQWPASGRQGRAHHS